MIPSRSSLRRAAGAALLAALLATIGCAAMPVPRVLEQADEVSQSPLAREAKQHAAPSWARAEKVRLEAHEALQKGPAARAQFLGEESIALYHAGASLARLAKAAVRESSSQVENETLARELSQLDAAQARAAADVDALEQRLRAAGDEHAAAPDGPERQQARRDAARALLVQGRLLCAAARVLGAGAAPTAPTASSPTDASAPATLAAELAAAEAKLVQVGASLADSKAASTADEAADARAQCMKILSRTRRSKVGTGSPDALLEEIAAMAARSKGGSLQPERDERGVSLTLRGAFDGDAPSTSARARLEELDRVAAAHPSFPVAIVVHTDRPVSAAERARLEAHAAALASLFKSVDRSRRVVIVAADDVPLVSRTSPERASNARVEIVFIAPEAL